MNDVEPRLYTMVIRELIRHENDVTNHRIMWLLVGQGLFANAYVGAGTMRAEVVSILAPLGILVTLSAFVMLYKSYQARGYLTFLGNEAKHGTLREEHVPLSGWQQKRVKQWRVGTWLCPWLGQVGDVLEPYFTLPSLLMVAWLFLLLHHLLQINPGALLIIGMGLVMVILAGTCVLWVWLQKRREDSE